MDSSLSKQTKTKFATQSLNKSQNTQNPFIFFNYLQTSKKPRRDQNMAIRKYQSHELQIANFNEKQVQRLLNLKTSAKNLNSIQFMPNVVNNNPNIKSVNKKMIDSNLVENDLDQIQGGLKRPNKIELTNLADGQEQSTKSQHSVDKMSIYTFASKQQNRNKKSLLSMASTFRNDSIIFSNPQEKQRVEKMKRQNPLLYLTTQDYEAFHSSPLELELFLAKRQDPFLRQFVNVQYEPERRKLRGKIKEQMLELINIRQGKYITNLILTDVLEEIINLDKLEEQVDKQIQEYQSKSKRQKQQSFNSASIQNKNLKSSSFSNQIGSQRPIDQLDKGSKKFIKSNFIKQNEGEVQFETNSIKNQKNIMLSDSFLSSSSQVFNQNLTKPQPNTQINKSPRLKKPTYFQPEIEKKFRMNNQNSKLELQNSSLQKQTENLQKEFASYQKALEELKSHHLKIEQEIKKQEAQLCQIQGHLNLIQEQYSLFIAQCLEAQNYIRKSILSQQKLIIQLKQNIIADTKDLNENQLSLLLQHIFDVLYIQLQIISNKELKIVTNNKNSLKQSPSTKTGILQTLYSTFTSSLTLYQKLKKCSNDWNFSSQLQEYSVRQQKIHKALIYYWNLERFLKIYMCYKIEQHKIKNQKKEVKQKNQQVCYLNQLFNLLDTNSYHSPILKEQLFHFHSEFLAFGKNIGSFLFSNLIKPQNFEEKLIGHNLIKIDQSYQNQEVQNLKSTNNPESMQINFYQKRFSRVFAEALQSSFTFLEIQAKSKLSQLHEMCLNKIERPNHSNSPDTDI